MENDRHLIISFTSDIHGYFSDIDYASGKKHASGLCNCAGLFARGENTLIIDGGDTIQGSPFTFFYHRDFHSEHYLPASVMNTAGYRFVTLGNHDFTYGVPRLETYLSQLHAICLCANVRGVRGVQETAVVTMENGLRIGLTGVTSPYVTRWEPPENLIGVTVTDAFTAAKHALEKLKKEKPDVTICIYHGGFERDVLTGAPLSSAAENQGYRICTELDYDVLLSSHQHLMLENICLAGTHTCQCPDKASGFIRLEMDVPGHEHLEEIRTVSRFIPAGEHPDPELLSLLSEAETEAAQWMDQPVGRFDRPLPAGTPLERAVNGSLIANFFNQVQLAASGADLSVTSLNSGVKGFSEDVSIRNILSNYTFQNTLKTVEVDRTVLKSALERCAEYFAVDENGDPAVSEAFLYPIVQHYNYDFFSGIETVIDIRRPVGNRVVSIRYQGHELEEDRKLTLCMNSYRASGAGGYPFYASCPLIKDQPVEIAEMIMNYVTTRHSIKVDGNRYLTVIY